MLHIGRDDDPPGAPTARFGRVRARDGSLGGPVGLDLDRTHAGLVVGKRGSGKSHTLGVLAEELARADGVTAVVLDPTGCFGGLAGPPAPESASPPPARSVRPRVRADALAPAAWPAVFGLDASAPVGALIWEAAAETDALSAMRRHVRNSAAARPVRRAAANHLRLAASWDVFDPDGLAPPDLDRDVAAVLDLSGMAPAAVGAVCAAVVAGVHAARIGGTFDRLPWLLVDEAHVAFEGVAAAAMRAVFTRGRAPGVSVLAATQRPGALPAVAVSQADLLVAHRLTAVADREALAAARPAGVGGSLGERLPDAVGDALVVDDANAAVHTVAVRPRETPHGGTTPRVSDRRGRDADRTPADSDPGSAAGSPSGRSAAPERPLGAIPGVDGPPEAGD